MDYILYSYSQLDLLVLSIYSVFYEESILLLSDKNQMKLYSCLKLNLLCFLLINKLIALNHVDYQLVCRVLFGEGK